MTTAVGLSGFLGVCLLLFFPFPAFVRHKLRKTGGILPPATKQSPRPLYFKPDATKEPVIAKVMRETITKALGKRGTAETGDATAQPDAGVRQVVSQAEEGGQRRGIYKGRGSAVDEWLDGEDKEVEITLWSTKKTVYRFWGLDDEVVFLSLCDYQALSFSSAGRSRSNADSSIPCVSSCEYRVSTMQLGSSVPPVSIKPPPTRIPSIRHGEIASCDRKAQFPLWAMLGKRGRKEPAYGVEVPRSSLIGQRASSCVAGSSGCKTTGVLVQPKMQPQKSKSKFLKCRPPRPQRG
ncbi:hypothetical protein V8F06_001346 [Rhypophila decipiens]